MRKRERAILVAIRDMDAEGPVLGHFTTDEMHGVRDRGWIAIDHGQADRRLRWTLTDAGREALRLDGERVARRLGVVL